jgi:hypothetical protein
MTDIKTHGPYQNLVSDGGGAYQQDGSWAQPYGIKNIDNPYIAAFWKWWEGDLQHSLRELRITGGEATMSQDFWRLIDWWNQHPECDVGLAVNSNLGAKQQLIERLCEATHSFKNFRLYTSNECFGNQAEYIRDGLDWSVWLDNLRMMISKGNCKSTHIMMTINALCLFSIIEFMEEMLSIRRQYGNHHCNMSFNILRFPSFMSPLTLPENIRFELSNKIESWIDAKWSEQENSDLEGRGLLNQMEYEGIKRLVSYLRELNEGHNQTSSLESRQRDFKSFFMQYDQRRGKNFKKVFPELTDWYDSIPETNLAPLIKLISGDSTLGSNQAEELIEKANTEKWILKPTHANPGSENYVKPIEGYQIQMEKKGDI